MNQRENFFKMLNGEMPEFVPIMPDLYKLCMIGTCVFDQPMFCNGKDPFGVSWVVTKEGSIPEPNNFMFDDIADWEKYVRFPDVEKMGLEEAVKEEVASIDREARIVNVFSGTGLFDRMTSLMGYENALCSLIEDPDSCRAFFEAMADYKIACINKMIDVYQPDMVTYFDDLATANGLFMSPAVYRSVIKPAHSRILAAIAERGVIPNQHTCGKCEEIVGDYVEMGVKLWNSAQIMNDLIGIMDRYKGRLIVEGGWDSSGPASYNDATVDDIVAEGIRCAKEYGPKGNYICMPVFMNENGNAMVVGGDPRFEALLETWHEVSKL